MARNPTNFFTAERRKVLEDIMGEIPAEEIAVLTSIGEYSARKLWPKERYDRINDPNDGRNISIKLSANNGHDAFKRAIDPLIDNEGGLGFRGSFLPEIAGGIGLSIPSYMMCLEMIAQGNASVALSLLIDGSVLNSIWRLGDEQQKQRYVVDALRHKKMTAFGLTEPGHGSDAGDLTTTATSEVTHYILNGQKNWITNGDWAEYYFVVVRTNPDRSLGPRGLSIIMVHRDEITDVSLIDKYTVPGSFTAELYFTDAVVPYEDNGVRRMIGEKDRGFIDAKSLLEGGRVTVAAFGLGIATEAFEMAVDYAKERKTQGRPLIENQGISFPIAEYDTELDAARLLTYRAAMRMQNGENMTSAEASKAKLFANNLAQRLAEFNRRLFASYGLAKEYRCMQLVHDAGVGVTGEGTEEVQKILIASARKRNS